MVLSAKAHRILILLQNDHFQLAGLEQQPLAKMIEQVVQILKEKINS
jgi:hypothetical protein